MARELTEDETATLDGFVAKLGYTPGVFVMPAQIVIVRKPTEQEYIRFQQRSTDAMMAAAAPKKRAGATTLIDVQRELALACTAYPADLAEKKSLLADKPALVPKISDKATELAGDDIEDLEGN